LPTDGIKTLETLKTIQMYKVFIAGSGGIGSATGLILAHYDFMDCKVVLGDINGAAGKKAVKFVNEGSGTKKASFALMPREGISARLEKVIKDCDIILDCLPGSQAPRMARWAKKYKCHYANLTEYVDETEQVMKIAAKAKTGFLLQTGLAPGFINVLACRLYEEFVQRHGIKVVEHIEMKVGALSRHAAGPHFYAFTWSPVGVATEYLKDAYIVRDFEKVAIPALSGLENLIVDGEDYEDNFTSGGAADLPEFFEGKAKNLDYKTIRYRGHYNWVKENLSKMFAKKNKIALLQAEMLDKIPMVEDDKVIIYSAVKGRDKNGLLRGVEASYDIKPAQVGTKMLRAIQTTTACALCESARILLTGNHKGVILQSQIPTDAFMEGPYVKEFYGALDLA
jgi:saccharopine dehydrogenase-like NADP-dependent oxidoreductase